MRASSAWGRAAGRTASGPGRIAELDAWWTGLVGGAVVRDDVDRPGTGPIAFGSVSYAAESAAGATLVVPEVVVGFRAGVAWLTTVGVEQAPAVPAVPGHPEVARQAAAGGPARRGLRRRRAVPCAVGGGGGRGRLAHHVRAARQGRPRARPRGHQRRRRSTCAGSCTASPSATTRRGSSRSTASWAPPPSCSCAGRRGWSPHGCSRARSAAPATTSTTWRSRHPSPARARTSRSTSTPCARCRKPLRRTAPR